MSQRIGVYPGTFDPVTNGHMDIIQRATRVLDHLIVGVARNAGKGPLFSTEERVQMVEEDVAALKPNGTRIEVRPFDSLLMHFAMDMNASVIIRGLRAVSDFEYEFQMAGMNRRLFPEVETLFLTPSEEHTFVSATIVREIAKFGGDVSSFVHPAVLSRLKTKVTARK